MLREIEQQRANLTLSESPFVMETETSLTLRMDNLGWGTMFPLLISGGHGALGLPSVARSLAEKARLVPLTEWPAISSTRFRHPDHHSETIGSVIGFASEC